MPIFAIWAALFLIMATGWIFNVMALVAMNWETALNIEGILRIVGLVVVPLGTVMGFFA